jgi:hypothetical protein
MIARMAGTVLWAAIVFVVVSVLVSLGVLWWTGGLLSSVMVGLICGLAAAFTISAVSTMAGRTESPSERPDDRN